MQKKSVLEIMEEEAKCPQGYRIYGIGSRPGKGRALVMSERIYLGWSKNSNMVQIKSILTSSSLMAESEEELKSLLMKGKEETEKVGLKLNIQKMKFTASGPITSWEMDGETVETVSDFIFLGSKITADGDCRHEIERPLLLEEVMTNLDSIFKSRDITLPTKVHLVKAMVFPVVMYGCESWTVKKTEC